MKLAKRPLPVASSTSVSAVRHSPLVVFRIIASACLACCLPVAAPAQSAPTRAWTGNHASTVTSVAIPANGSILVSGSFDQTAKIWRSSDGVLLRTLSGHVGEIRAVAVSRDASLVATASTDRTVKIWRASDGLLLRTLVGHSDAVRAVAFSPDGSVLASGGQDQMVFMWRVSDGTPLRVLSGNASWVMSVAYSPDGAAVVAGGADGSVTSWRAVDGAIQWRVAGHGDWVMSVAFSPDGGLVASGGLDFTAKLWRAGDGALVRAITGFADGVNSVAFSPTGSNLFTTDWRLTIKKWRMSDGALLQSFTESALLYAVCVAPDDSRFAYGLGDGSVVMALNSASGGAAVPTLDVLVSTSKPAYVNREKAAILVSVTDGTIAVADAAVTATVTSAKGLRTSLKGTTGANGVATFTYSVNATKQGVGAYLVEASASKTGYTAGTDSASFQVSK